jgi:anti-anti-sigma regulatory factor
MDTRDKKAARTRKPPATAPETLATDIVVALPAVRDFLYARPLHQQLVEAMASKAAVVIEGAAVERSSTPCIQALLAAARRADKSSIEFHLRNASETIVARLTRSAFVRNSRSGWNRHEQTRRHCR